MYNRESQHPAIRPLPSNLPGEYIGVGDPNDASFVGEVQLREYWKVVWKYRMLIAVVTVFSLLIATVYLFTVTPRYSASSKIRIGTYEPILAATKVEDVLERNSREANYLETQIEEIKSFSLADQVLQDEQIYTALFSEKSKGFWQMVFGEGDESKSDLTEALDTVSGYRRPISDIKAYLDGVVVKPVRRTALVNIEVTHTNPELSALIANRHALAYIDWVRENRVQQQSRGLKFLRQQAVDLRERVADLEREIADYAEENSIVAVNKDENITVQKMSQLNQLMTAATAKRIEIENQYREAKEGLSKESAGYDDPSTQSMRSELARLRAEHGQLSAKFTASYPRVQQLKAQIDELSRSIKDQRGQIVAGLNSKYLAAVEEEKNLKEELERQKSLAFELSKRQVQYNVLNRDLTTSRDLLQNVLKQIEETSLAVESNASSITVVDYAVTPQSPSFPRKRVVLLVGLILGVGVGVGVAFLINYLDNTVRTPEDLSTLLQLPNLGVVPSFELDCIDSVAEHAGHSSRRHSSQEGNSANGTGQSCQGDSEVLAPVPADLFPVVYLSNPRSLASEAYRTIRTAILLSQAGEPPRTILVSSAQSGEGKTTSSINLAASLASAGGRVVLIDADLRRPSMLRHFNLSVDNVPGLVDVLTGQAAVQDVVLSDILKRISVIASGRVPPNPAELLGSVEMASLIDQLANDFDYVLIDSPPVLPVTDAMILSRFVDGVVLVVKGANTPRKVVRDAKDRLQSVGARLLGTILNDVDINGGDYYYYNRYYHSYYQESVEQTVSGEPRQSARNE